MSQGAWQSCLHQLVLGYLVHHGYYNTALTFASSTSQAISEEIASIKNRQSESSFVTLMCMWWSVQCNRNTGMYTKGACQWGPAVGATSIPSAAWEQQAITLQTEVSPICGDDWGLWQNQYWSAKTLLHFRSRKFEWGQYTPTCNTRQDHTHFTGWSHAPFTSP